MRLWKKRKNYSFGNNKKDKALSFTENNRGGLMCVNLKAKKGVVVKERLGFRYYKMTKWKVLTGFEKLGSSSTIQQCVLSMSDF